MLQHRAEDRITLAEIRTHSWLQNGCSSSQAKPLSSLESLQECASIESLDLTSSKLQDKDAFRTSLKLDFASFDGRHEGKAWPFLAALEPSKM